MHLHWLRSRFHLVALAVALLLGAASWLGTRQYLALRASQVEQRLAEKYERARVLVAGEDLTAGSLLTTAVLATREVPVRYIPSSSARVEDLSRVEGQRLLTPLKAGDPVPTSALAGGGDLAFSTQLEPGRRAITVPVDDVNAIAGLLVPGDLVDLLYTERRGTQSAVRPLLQKVLVLATGTTTERAALDAQGGAGAADATSFTTVTLSVTPEEAQRVVLAQRAGELTAVLRHPADAAAVPGTPLGSASLSGSASGARAVARAAPQYVEFIVGGSNGRAARSREPLESPPFLPSSGTASPGLTPPPATPRADAGNVRARLGMTGTAAP